MGFLALHKKLNKRNYMMSRVLPTMVTDVGHCLSLILMTLVSVPISVPSIYVALHVYDPESRGRPLSL